MVVRCLYYYFTPILLFIITIKGECPEGCSESTLLYQQLNCKAIYTSKSDCCPSKFDCSNFFNRPKNKCHFLGKFYKRYQSVPDEIITAASVSNCRCYNFNNKLEFLCTAVVCPEYTNKFRSTGCLPRYNLHSLCAIGEICPTTKLNSIKINGEIIYESQKFLLDACKVCVYREGYNGSYPYCKDSCFPELTNSLDIDDFCAPVYVVPGDCCPIEWICPPSTDNIISTVTQNNAFSSNKIIFGVPLIKGFQCRFGNTLLNKGDVFVSQSGLNSENLVDCECRVPPFVTCTWRDNSTDLVNLR